LQEAWRARIEHPSRDIDVRHGIAIKQKVAAAGINEKRNRRDSDRQHCYPGDFAVPAARRLHP